MNLIDHARHELELGGFFSDGDTLMGDCVIELLKVFANQEHSGSSAPFAVHLFKELAMYRPLSPLTGEPDEWEEVDLGLGEPTGEGDVSSDAKVVRRYQNIRCGHVFKDWPDGEAYDVRGIIFREKHSGDCFVSSKSVIPIAFPYTPKETIQEVEDEG
jgi:hypothetical protein